MRPQENQMPFDILKALTASATPPIPPPAAAPAASPLAALAAKMPPAKQAGATNVTISGPAQGSIVWNSDKTYWREKNSPNWRPAKEYSPAMETKTTKVVK